MSNRRFTILNTSGNFVFEIEGQSNAVGTRPIAQLPSDLTSLTGIKMYNPNSSLWADMVIGTGTTGSTDPADTDGYFGIEGRLSKLIHDYYVTNVWLIKYARSGTGLETSSSSIVWKSTTSGQMYTLSNTNTSNARTAITTFSNKNVKFIVWMQGENDTTNSTFANNYQANLTAFINAKRAVYGYDFYFIIVSLSSGQTSLNTINRGIINAAQTAVAAALTKVYVVTQNEATVDGTHYTATGYNNIATAVFNLVKTLPL